MLNAGKGTVIDGKRQGSGRIEKTGCDTLGLAGDADSGGDHIVKVPAFDAGRTHKAASVGLNKGTRVKADLDF